MASLTFNATNIHVLSVIEIRQVRKVVNPNPFDRFIIFVRCDNFANLPSPVTFLV